MLITSNLEGNSFFCVFIKLSATFLIFSLFPLVHRLKGMSEGVISPCFDLHKNDDALVFRYNVDLSKNGPVILS